jgi:CRP/FNR family cyclic AMP-dependent transcriptional regulator
VSGSRSSGLSRRYSLLRVLHEQHALSDLFIAHLLMRNVHIERDLIDLLFNSAEKRLARALLLLAHHGDPGTPQRSISKISHAALAGRAGITRARVDFFMNRFKKLGFIERDGRTINGSLLNVVLYD